jgi:CTP synthase
LNPVSARAPKYVFVTGGVVSALGKGIVAASLGRLLKARGLRVQLQKFDPYLNVDPGTMSPFQHGEVFVTEDGAETDLDIGHYERFVDENFLRSSSHSAGAVWDTVLRKERKGDFLGATVQVIPHITNEIKARIRRGAEARPTDVVISEIGGTVGDIESLPFLEAIRQFRREVGPENVMYIHVTLVPFIEAAGELKTKPTQHSVNELRRIGIHPDVVVCRSHEELSRDIRDKIALFADVDPGAVIASPDVPDVYLVPQVLQAEGLDRLVCEKLGLPEGEADLGEWAELTKRIDERRELVEIALVGKYVKLQDAYLSVHEALKHAGLHNGCAVRVRWVDAENMSYEETAELLDTVDGVLVPGGFGSRGWEGKILACQVARERRIPYLGICLGMHVAVSEFARHIVGLEGANSTEMDPETPYAVIDLLPEQKGVEDLGGTMRLGAQAVEVAEGTRARELYGEAVIFERHRHRYEVNNLFRDQLVDAGLVVSGTFEQGRLVEIIELPDHPWFVASQFHPEFKSRPTRPAPLFQGFVSAALDRARTRSGDAVATSS